MWTKNIGGMHELLQVAQNSAWSGFAAAADVIRPHSFLPTKISAMIECPEIRKSQQFLLNVPNTKALCERLIVQARASVLVQSPSLFENPRPLVICKNKGSPVLNKRHRY